MRRHGSRACTSERWISTRRQRRDLERVADRPRVVRPRARVQQDPRRPARAARAGARRTRPRGWSGRSSPAGPARARAPCDPLLQLGERQRAVQRRVAPPELVEVDPVHHLDALACRSSPRHHRGCASSATAARSSPPATSQPCAPRPGAPAARTAASRPTRFLSRALAAHHLLDRRRPRAAPAARARAAARAPARAAPRRPDRRSAASRPSPTASPWR